MSEYANNCGCNNGDAVPIKVNRVFDSCSDKDCITGVQGCSDVAGTAVCNYSQIKMYNSIECMHEC